VSYLVKHRDFTLPIKMYGDISTLRWRVQHHSVTVFT